MKMKITKILLLLFVSFSSHAKEWQAELIVSGLNVPWGMAVIDEQRLLVTERNGDVGILNHESRNYQRILTYPNVIAKGQGGLLDVARSPFEPSTFYFTYSRDTRTGIETILAKAVLAEDKLTKLTDLFTSHSGSRTGRHFGSRITFDDQYIFFSIGDRGERANGQNLQTHAGSILRLNPDGSIPQSNPFYDQGKIASAIWSYGHRNPQGLFHDEYSNQLWSIEHGPRGGDEINLIAKGENYGWPVTSHGKEYWGPIAVGEAKEMAGITSPLKTYVPSIAPSSMILYRGERYLPLRDKFIIGSLKLAHLNIVSLSDNKIVDEQRILQHLGERIRSLVLTPNDKIIFATDRGNIYHLVLVAE
ncbi:PQQ-dependent sugar dehydrogenase [Vibrio sp. 404]|uniref:PQQ-dependent sugar dehydrogenase n=1 Tax=Vibrio marinisediminis TaxID=2758441 RepID=A0A7W2FQX4_9VIBR|nr:PQQ-dependent sugar dehydrogenase [Vibrio marinisediminis]